MAVVHSYARFSHSSQVSGDSTRRQNDILEKFVQDGEHTLSDLRYWDSGKSAFRGDKQKYLTEFLTILDARDGRINRGDILFIEAIDRLSRKGIRATQDVFNQILNAGVNIYTAFPAPKLYKASDTNDLGSAVELTVLAYGANAYSENLSIRVKEFHKKSRKAAYENGMKINSGPVPCWLIRQKKNDVVSFTVKPGASDTINHILQRMIDGAGGHQLCKELNEKFPSFGRSGKWNDTFITYLINDRRILGEFCPRASDDKSNKQPITDYFPRIVSDELYFAALSARANRKNERGPQHKRINIWSGLVFYAGDNCAANISTYQQKRADGRKVVYRRLRSQNAIDKMPGASSETVDVQCFTNAVLRNLSELDVSFFHKKKNVSQLQVLRQQRKEKIDGENEILEQIKIAPKMAGKLMSVLEEIGDEISDLEKRILEAEQNEVANPVEQLQNIKALKDLDDTQENRIRLRESLKQLIKGITILPVKLGEKKSDEIVCLIEIEFRNGKRKSVLQIKNISIAFTVEAPDSPGLREEKDLKTVKEKVLKSVKALKTLSLRR